MNPIEKQILHNQRDMMFWMGKDNAYEGYFGERIKQTEELLNPTKKKEDACDMSEVKKV